mgnify:CR=1 FL=1
MMVVMTITDTLLSQDHYVSHTIADALGFSASDSSPGLLLSMELMTLLEYKNGGEALRLYYDFIDSPFGRLALAFTERGMCQLFFEESVEKTVAHLGSQFPNASLQPADSFPLRQQSHIPLHLKATDFQLAVWQALLSIPIASTCSYGVIAAEISKPKAARAVGTAIANNPIALLIPCHRVIQASGQLGGYRWGKDRKKNVLAWEQGHKVGISKYRNTTLLS